jgi:putative flippase GtrA
MDDTSRAGSDEESPEQNGTPFFLPSGITDFEEEHPHDIASRTGSNRYSNAFHGTSNTSKLYGYWPDNPSYEVEKGAKADSKLWAFNTSQELQRTSDPLVQSDSSPSKSQETTTASPSSSQDDVKNMVFRVERAGSESSYVYTFNPRIHIPAGHPMADPASNNHSDNVRSMSSSPWKLRPRSEEFTPPSTPPLSIGGSGAAESKSPSTTPGRSERPGSLKVVLPPAHRAAQHRPLSSPPKMLTPIHTAAQHDLSFDKPQQYAQNLYREAPPSVQNPNSAPVTPPRTTVQSQQPYHTTSPYQQHPQAYQTQGGQSSGRYSHNRPGSNSFPTPVPYMLMPQGQVPMYRQAYHPHRGSSNNTQQNPPVQYWNGNWSYAAPQQPTSPNAQHSRDGRQEKKFKSPKKPPGRKNRASTGSTNYPGTITMAVADKPVWKVKGRANPTPATNTPTYAPKSPQRYEQVTRGKQLVKKEEVQMEYKQIKLLKRDDPDSQAYLTEVAQMAALSLEGKDTADYDDEYDDEEENDGGRCDDSDEYYHGYSGGNDGDDGEDGAAPGGDGVRGGGNVKNVQAYSGNNKTTQNNGSGGQDRRNTSTYKKQQQYTQMSYNYNHRDKQGIPSIIAIERPKHVNTTPCVVLKSQTERGTETTESIKPIAATGNQEISPSRALVSFFALGIGLLCALMFSLFSMLLHIHRVALTAGGKSALFTVVCVYAFPLLVSPLMNIVTWGPQFVWFIFLTWFCVASSTNSAANTSLYIRLLVLVFLTEGAYEGNFMLRSSGGERIVLAAVLVGVKSGRTVLTLGYLMALALAVGFGSNVFVQWVLLLALMYAGGKRDNITATTANTASNTNNYLMAKRQTSLRKIRRLRV